MSFTHLHVASGFSMKYGSLLPEDLVSEAANLGFNQLALTDRDEIGGAVRFVKSCIVNQVEPILGIDLPISTTGLLGNLTSQAKLKTPAKGGNYRNLAKPRAVLLARGRNGWKGLVNLATKIGELKFYDENSSLQVTDVAHALQQAAPKGYSPADSPVVVLLGPESEFAAAVIGRRPDIALGIIKNWREVAGVMPVVAVATHHSQHGVFSTSAARKLISFADHHNLKSVLVNSVRYLAAKDSYVADLLDAIRGLVPLHPKYISQTNSSAYLKSAIEMQALATEITQDSNRAKQLLLDTELLAAACVLNPVRDLDWGRIYLPELDLITGEKLVSDQPLHRPDDAKRAQSLLRTTAEAALAELGLDRDFSAQQRLTQELTTVAQLGFAAYFLAVARIVKNIKLAGSRVNVRGSAGGSFLVYLLGISQINPLEHGLLMERFLSASRRSLPDIDIDVESDKRISIYQSILQDFSNQRVAAVAMVDTYRVRHAIRDAAAALMFSPAEISALATAFPHIRAKDIRAAVADLPELRNSNILQLANLDQLFDCVAALDSLPRHRAMHPCGVIISDAGLLSRVPVIPSAQNFPVTVFDKDDVEDLGLIKLDVLGVRMQSAIRHTLSQIKNLTSQELDLATIPKDDPATFELIKSTKTLGCFQIESPGQRELVGKLAPESMHDLIVDISLFRPGPIKSDMIGPFLAGKHGWREPEYLHPDLKDVLAETWGVVVFHEQVMQILSIMTGCSLAQADEFRRNLGAVDTQFEVRGFFYERALAKGYNLEVVEQVWQTLKSFGSFGFCKAHAAAFALPTYESAWLKAHHPAAFLAGVLTHDPGMYPKRLILNEAKNFGIKILPLEINSSKADYQVEAILNNPSAKTFGIRLALHDISGISNIEIERILAGQPFDSLSDFWQRAHVSRPTVENLIKLGAFDQLHGVGANEIKSGLTRRDLLLQLADLINLKPKSTLTNQLTLELNAFDASKPSGLAEMSIAERVKAELQILGLDSSAHALSFYHRFLAELATKVNLQSSINLRKQRSGSIVFNAGVKVAIQTPPIRSGNRVAFLTLDDGTGPVDLAFFEDAQQQYSNVIFNSWLVLTAGELRKSGPNAVSLLGVGCWSLPQLYQIWKSAGLAEVVLQLQLSDPAEVKTRKFANSHNSNRVRRKTGGMGPARRLLIHASGLAISPYSDVVPTGSNSTNPRIGAAKSTDLVEDAAQLPTKLWHKSPGTGGR